MPESRTELRTSSLVAMIGAAATLAGLVGYGVGAGEWKGEVNQILVEHERRLNAADNRDERQDARDDRQDDHMRAIDQVAAETRGDLATIKAQVSWLVRRAREAL